MCRVPLPQGLECIPGVLSEGGEDAGRPSHIGRLVHVHHEQWLHVFDQQSLEICGNRPKTFGYERPSQQYRPILPRGTVVKIALPVACHHCLAP